MAEIQSYKPVQQNEWPNDLPNKNQFEGGDLDVQTHRWELRREPGSGGGNEVQDLNVPEGRILVGWSVDETSCNHCKGGSAYHIVIKTRGTHSFPIGIHVGAKLEPGGLGSHGASFTGNLSLISATRSAWDIVDRA